MLILLLGLGSLLPFTCGETITRTKKQGGLPNDIKNIVITKLLLLGKTTIIAHRTYKG